MSKSANRACGGVAAKIMTLRDALGNRIDFRLLPRQAHALRGTAALMEGFACGQLRAERRSMPTGSARQ
jgi:hypothetical protein